MHRQQSLVYNLAVYGKFPKRLARDVCNRILYKSQSVPSCSYQKRISKTRKGFQQVLHQARLVVQYSQIECVVSHHNILRMLTMRGRPTALILISLWLLILLMFSFLFSYYPALNEAHTTVPSSNVLSALPIRVTLT